MSLVISHRPDGQRFLLGLGGPLSLRIIVSPRSRELLRTYDQDKRFAAKVGLDAVCDIVKERVQHLSEQLK